MKTILLLTDFSKTAQHASEYAVAIAKKTGSRLLLYHAFYLPQVYAPNELMPYYGDYSVLEREDLEKLKMEVRSLEKKLAVDEKQPDVNVDAKPLVSCAHSPGTIGESLVDVLKENDVWMIVMGEKGKDSLMDRLLFGSDSREVIDKSTCPILLVPPKADFKGFQKIGFATDLNATNADEIKFLAEFAREFDAELLVTHVSKGEAVDRLVKSHRDRLMHLLDGEKGQKVTFREIESEDLPNALNVFANVLDVDALALIHRKHHFPESIVHHSTTKDMLTNIQIPMLVLPARMI